MKVYNIRNLYREKYQEYILGSAELGKHSVYLAYGEASCNEERTMTPEGHDEILFILEGKAELKSSTNATTIGKEQAVYLNPSESFTFTALTDCRYIIAGAHATPHEH
jgi:mannose-6-phosphate isomerase-like protein (cupin superfamily)